jgi:N-acetylmuramoyl-L-alanine amidase-like protein
MRLVWKALTGAGALAISRADPVPARDRDPNVFVGEEKFEQLLTLGRERAWSELPIGERVGAIGVALRQTPYVGGPGRERGLARGRPSLPGSRLRGRREMEPAPGYEDREVCSVNLRGLDCVTFFEISLAFARMLRRDGRGPEALLAEVTFIRYRGGRLTDYASRLHYLSDWFFDNEHKRVVRVTTRELPGATRLTKRINFMSTHPEAYRQLTANADTVGKIAGVEAEINAREIQHVPREKVGAVQPLLMTGDIVGVTTTIDGLDCAHAGFCYRDEEGVLRLLHASTTQNAVILDAELATYLGSVSTHTGIMVARPLEVE